MTKILKFQATKQPGWRVKPAEIAAVGLALKAKRAPVL